jgi:hypothetical protein
MSVHNSILAARIKQTQDANWKRQSIPLLKGDLAYLSTQNISFQKGLAQKLIPKFIGPYKILQVFGNVLGSGSRISDSGLQRWNLKGLGLSLCAVPS